LHIFPDCSYSLITNLGNVGTVRVRAEQWFPAGPFYTRKASDSKHWQGTGVLL
jgi:hypothetical protein